MNDQYTAIRERFLDDAAPRLINKYIFSTPTKFTGKTWVYDIVSRSNKQTLGQVKWYAPWRQYWFEPAHKTGFNSKCGHDIFDFVDTLMEERKTRSSGESTNE